jgi:hypothetical protein
VVARRSLVRVAPAPYPFYGVGVSGARYVFKTLKPAPHPFYGVGVEVTPMILEGNWCFYE